jgi:hypothetical protein
MTNLKNLIWIASYPKSGNTWMRSILTALIYSKDGKFDFNLLPNIDQFETYKNFNFVKNIDINDYNSLDELKSVSKYWQKAQENIKSKDLIFFKTHSANYNHNNLKYTNFNKTRGCIYIVRDPRDVAISYSKFIGHNIDDTIEYMMGASRQIWNQEKKIGIILSRWDYHISSWLNLESPKIFIKYEDLLIKTKPVLNELINFLTITLNIKIENIEEKINNVITTTSFDVLKNKEETAGFKEASKSSPFFRSGKSKQWKTILNKDQIKKIEKNFSEYMIKFNYI